MSPSLKAQILLHLYGGEANSEASFRLLKAQYANNDQHEREWHAIVEAMGLIGRDAGKERSALH